MIKKCVCCYLLVLLVFSSIFYICPVKSADSEDETYYGFIVPVDETQSDLMQICIVRQITWCLKHNVSVYWITEESNLAVKPLVGSAEKTNRTFGKGSFFIDSSDEPDLLQFYAANLSYLSYACETPVYCVVEEISKLNVMKLHFPSIVLHGGDNVGTWDYSSVLATAGFSSVSTLGWREIPTNLSIDDYDIFIWGGHYGNWFDVLIGQMNIDTLNRIRSFIADGGGYISSCYGSYEITTMLPYPFRNLLVNHPKLPSLFFLSTSKRLPVMAIPGRCLVNITLTDSSSPLSFGLPERINNTWYANGPIFLGKEGDTKTIAVIDSVDSTFLYSDSNLADYSFLSSISDRWIEYSLGKPIWITTDFGEGKIVSFGNHPEDHYSYPRIVHNAVFYASASSKEQKSFDEPLYLFDLTKVLNVSSYRGYISRPLEFGLIESENISFLNVTWLFVNERLSYDVHCKQCFDYSGHHQILVTAVDENNRVGSTSLTVNISENVSGCILCSQSDILVNESVSFSFNASGGFSPYSYHWFVDSSLASINDSFSYAFSESGNHILELAVFDDSGEQFLFDEIVEVVSGEVDTEDEMPADDNTQNNDSDSSESILLYAGIASLLIIVLYLVFIVLQKH